jgi:hypothetical protein
LTWVSLQPQGWWILIALQCPLASCLVPMRETPIPPSVDPLT